MEWIHMSILLLVLTSSVILLDAWKCPISGTPIYDDVLMEAFYVADPDPDTGYISFWGSYYYMHPSLVNSKVNFTTWKTRQHDGMQLFINLWSYFARLIVSNVYDIYGHYTVVEQMGENKTTGVIDFKKLEYLLYRRYDNFTSWPYSCVTQSYVTFLRYTISCMKGLVVNMDWAYENGQNIVTYSMKTSVEINEYSKLGIDVSRRCSCLEYLFSETVIQFIPSKTRTDVFYHSKLAQMSLEILAGDNTQFKSFVKDSRYYGYSAVESRMSSRCTDEGDTVVGKEYYCKVTNFILFSKQCAELNNSIPCLFDPQFQMHFNKGRFAESGDLKVINDVAHRTKIVLGIFRDKTTNNDVDGLRDLITKYSPYITVNDSMCVLDWPKAFDCTDNACRMKTMYRFDCIIKFVMTATKRYIDLRKTDVHSKSIEVKRANTELKIWLSYIPMGSDLSLSSADINEVILSTQKSINVYVTSYDTPGLTTFSNTLPPATLVPVWANKLACQTTTIARAYTIFCVLNPVINSIYIFLDAFKNSKHASIKDLNANEDYKILLKQLQIQRVQNFIVLQTEAYFNDLTGQLQQNFAALSTYFSSLANYDKTKAESDIAYIDGRLTTFKTKIAKLIDPVSTMLSTVMEFSLGANVAELISRTAELGVAVAQIANPLSTILGGSSFLDLASTLNELGQAGVQSAIIDYLGGQAMPDLITKGQALGEGFAANDKQFVVAKNLIKGLKSKTANATDYAKQFLKLYDSYDPKVLRSDITAYGTKFETVAEQLCEAAFAGGTAAAALVEIGLASSGECTELSSAIAQLITVYEELYDYQFDLMDSLSDASRAYLAYEKANDMKLIYTQGPRVDHAFLQKTAVMTFMVSTLNTWQIVTEYCDVLTYTSGGVVPEQCTTALATPSHNAVAQVLGYNPDPLCHINNEITDYRDIPIKPSSAGDTAYIDLKKLYKGETVTFKVPNFQWLKDHGWVGRQDSNKAIYIKRFEIFLPPMSGTSEQTIELIAAPSLSNYLKPGGTQYHLDLSGYTARYTENIFNCYHQRIDNPYTLCNSNALTRLCVTSNGMVNRKVQPSIFNDWRITAFNIPTNENEPKPVTHFKLQVGITMCMVTMPSKKKRDVFNVNPIPNPLLRRKRGALQCCSSTQYWNGTACTTCPAGSSQKLKGYYCQYS